MCNIQLRIDQLLVEAIDEVLSSLGEPVKNHIYMLLEEDFSITKTTLPKQTAEFSSLIYRLFGSHARLIEIKCMKSFYNKIKNESLLDTQTVDFDDNNFTFIAYTAKLRALLSTEVI